MVLARVTRHRCLNSDADPCLTNGRNIGIGEVPVSGSSRHEPMKCPYLCLYIPASTCMWSGSNGRRVNE